MSVSSGMSQVLGQDKQFDSLHWFDSARQHLIGEKRRIEDGLDINSTRGGMNALEIWSQKLSAISVEQAQNMQLVIVFSSYVVYEAFGFAY